MSGPTAEPTLADRAFANIVTTSVAPPSFDMPPSYGADEGFAARLTAQGYTLPDRADLLAIGEAPFPNAPLVWQRMKGGVLTDRRVTYEDAR